MSDKMTVIHHQHREMQSPLILATKAEFFVTKSEMLIALATVRISHNFEP